MTLNFKKYYQNTNKRKKVNLISESFCIITKDARTNLEDQSRSFCDNKDIYNSKTGLECNQYMGSALLTGDFGMTTERSNGEISGY